MSKYAKLLLEQRRIAIEKQKANLDKSKPEIAKKDTELADGKVDNGMLRAKQRIKET